MTATCLGTLLFSVTQLKLSCEFILVDDNSSPDERILDVFRQHRAQAQGHACKLVRAKTHQHYSGVFTAGLSLATRDNIFFISNDMMVTPTFLLGLLSVASLSEEYGMVRGCSNFTDSHPEHCITPPAPVKNFQDVTNFSGTVFGTVGLATYEDRLMTGDAIMVKRSVIDKIGVLDLRFFGYFGDVDYGMRAHLAGFKLVCAKGAWLFHSGQGHVRREVEKQAQSTFQEHMARRMALVEKGYQEFRQKWSTALPPRYDQVASLHYFDTARANAHKIDLKYEPPTQFMDAFEFH